MGKLLKICVSSSDTLTSVLNHPLRDNNNTHFSNFIILPADYRLHITFLVLPTNEYLNVIVCVLCSRASGHSMCWCYNSHILFKLIYNILQIKLLKLMHSDPKLIQFHLCHLSIKATLQPTNQQLIKLKKILINFKKI